MKNTLRMAILSILLVIGLNTSLNAQTTRSAATYAEFTSAYTNSVDNDIINITNNIVVAAQVTISKSLTINGNGYTISVPRPGLDDMGRYNSTPSAFRVFEFNTAGKSSIINNLIIKGGFVSGDFGGSIYISSTSAKLTLNNCIITSSRALGGGGIGNLGVLFLNNSFIRRNGADYGGGVLNNAGKIYLESCTMVENRVTSNYGGGGAVENKMAGYMYFNNSTLSNNQAELVGGAINNYSSTLYFVNSSVTGNVVYGFNHASLCVGGSISNNGGTLYAVNSLFAHNYRATAGTAANPTSYILDDVVAYSGQANVNLYYSVYQATLPSGMGTLVSNTQYTGAADGSNNTIFSGGSLSKLTDNSGNEIGDAIYRPFLYNNNGSVAPTLQSGSYVLSHLGTRTRYANNNNSNPVVAYYNGSSYVNLTGTSASGQEVVLDQVGAARPDPPTRGAIQGTVDNLYMVKVLGSSTGTVNGGTLYGDVYPSGTSVSITAIPNAGFSFTRYDYVLGGTGTASASNPFPFTVSSNTTLQPVFTELSGGNYTITYVGNGNTGGTVPAVGTFSAATTIAAVGDLVRTGYTFNGWNTNSNGSGTSYASGDNYSTVATLTLYAQWTGQAIRVTANAGTQGPTDYTSLKAAFDAINAGTHQGAITIMVNASTTETASAVLYQTGYNSTSSYTSVNIYPTITGLSITGDLATPLIDLNGANKVIINGSLNGVNAGKSLTISNTSTSNTAGTSTIRFINDASTNTVEYCTIKGSSLYDLGGVVFFSTTNVATGNHGNLIDNNNITNSTDANRPLNAI